MFPYVILTVLACKALSLEGALDGIRFLFTPDWDRLTYSECWIDGGTQGLNSIEFQQDVQQGFQQSTGHSVVLLKIPLNSQLKFN